MTKTIKNITPRAVGDTFDVAYLSDLSTLNSGLSTKIDTLRQVIGGSDWELSTAVSFSGRWIGGGSDTNTFLAGAIRLLEEGLALTIGSYSTSEHYVVPDSDIYLDIEALDNKFGTYTDSEHYCVGDFIFPSLEALDNNVDATIINVTNINTGLGEQLDVVTGIATFNGSYLGGITTYGGAIEALDNAIVDVNEQAGQNSTRIDNLASILANAMDDGGGRYYDSDTGELDFSSGEGIRYIGDATNVCDALVALDAAAWDNFVATNSLGDALGTGYQTSDNHGVMQFPGTSYIASANSVTSAFYALDSAITNAQTAVIVTLETRETPDSGYAATYDIYQGGSGPANLVGTINIPKDFLVKSAALSTVTTAGVPYAGAKVGDKYIDFVINAKDASETAEHIYLPVNDLVDVYTAQQNATQVQLAIDANNVISATIVDSSVTTVKIADNAVTTAKIADGAVNTNKIRLIDTATTGQYAGKAYTLQVTNGRLQVKELPSQTTI